MQRLLGPFTVRKMIGVTAILAVAFSMFEGIGELSIYRPNVESEKLYWQLVATCEAMKNGIEAAKWRQRAIETGRRNRAGMPYIVTALSLIGLGIVSLGLVGLSPFQRNLN